MRRLSLVTSLFLLLGAARPIRADLLIGTMTIYGTESGTFQGQAFTNALVTFTATYDISQVVQTGGGMDAQGRLRPIIWTAPSSVGQVTVDGIGSGAFLGSGSVYTTSIEDFVGAPGAYIMFFPGGVTGLFQNESCSGAHIDRNLDRASGPTQEFYFSGPPPSPYTVHTSAGDLILNNVAEDAWTARVDVVPEPSSLILLGIGAVSLAGYGWARKHFKQAA
jgi:hypothetical protein